jgi:hypothetical protein
VAKSHCLGGYQRCRTPISIAADGAWDFEPRIPPISSLDSAAIKRSDFAELDRAGLNQESRHSLAIAVACQKEVFMVMCRIPLAMFDRRARKRRPWFAAGNKAAVPLERGARIPKCRKCLRFVPLWLLQNCFPGLCSFLRHGTRIGCA